MTTDYSLVNRSEYTGKVFAPVFPGIYATYKMDKLAFSFGFNPIGGGGGGTFEDGLPSFEYPLTGLLAAPGVSGYRADINFEGQSVYFGYQANISYQINDMISIAVGGRFTMAKEKYNGYMRNIELNMGGDWFLATNVFSDLATQAGNGLASLNGAVASMQPLFDANFGDMTFAELEGDGRIDATTRAQLEGGLLAVGQSQAAIDDMTLTEARFVYVVAATIVEDQYDQARTTAIITQDQEVEYEKTATGITPVISLDIKPSDKLNIAIKYEHITKLEFENNTTKDFMVGYDLDAGDSLTMFPNGAKSQYDIPGNLTVGATFYPTDKIMLSTGFHYFMDKQADWEGRQDSLKSNSFEMAFGAEYALTDDLKASVGWMISRPNPTGGFQTDLSQSMPSNSWGFGFAYQLSPIIELNVAGQYSLYQTSERTFGYPGESPAVLITETYKKPIWIAAVGLNFNFGADK